MRHLLAGSTRKTCLGAYEKDSWAALVLGPALVKGSRAHRVKSTYQGVRYFSFSGTFSYLLDGCSQSEFI